MGSLQFHQCFADHFLGKAGTFATLTGNARGQPDFFVAAASFIDRIADFTVGDASAEANIHKRRPSLVYVSNAMDLNVNENDCQSALREHFLKADERFSAAAQALILLKRFYLGGKNR
ncbi:hypothetical protein SAMN04490202_3798 [Pseudomonas reinekei]|uniref:Uncharacterized protein n=1 Tax=Pseudomonas reinekei TaxID=395598 RepID=A0A1H0RW16_PSERE|nr:hypothetical protein SAMN04490202_3798 [Pseudomonas reinekei]